MAKITLNKTWNSFSGRLKSAAVAAIKKPTSPWVIQYLNRKLSLTSPRYNRMKAEGGQVDVRQHLGGAGEAYKWLPQSARDLLQEDVNRWNYRTPRGPRLNTYTYFVKIIVLAASSKINCYNASLPRIWDPSEYLMYWNDRDWWGAQPIEPGDYMITCYGGYWYNKAAEGPGHGCMYVPPPGMPGKVTVKAWCNPNQTYWYRDGVTARFGNGFQKISYYSGGRQSFWRKNLSGYVGFRFRQRPLAAGAHCGYRGWKVDRPEKAQ